jgi:hypothetical protein
MKARTAPQIATKVTPIQRLSSTEPSEYLQGLSIAV